MVTFTIPVLLLIKNLTFWYMRRLSMSSYTRVVNF